MDLTARLIRRTRLLKSSEVQIVPRLLGRWVFQIWKNKKITYKDIRQEESHRSEVLLGYWAHYVIGIFLAAVYLLVLDICHINDLRLKILAAVIVGLFSNFFPWFFMFPSMGFGFLAKKIRSGNHILLISATNHVAYGVGLGLGTLLLDMVLKNYL